MNPSEIPPKLPPVSWYDRNWKWFIPLVIISAVMLLVLFVGGIVLGVFQLIKSSDVYKMALVEVQKNEHAQATLGTPITAKWYVTGSININGSSGHADLAVPLHGSKRDGCLYLNADKTAGAWEFNTLILQIGDGGQRFSLLGTNAHPARYPAN